jgi:diguanylate cyclase (GGDEF)-like protein/PAS domain S-box-containing protein
VQFSEFRNRSSLVWSAVLAALLFWLGDSLLDGIFFEGTGYYAELIPDEPKELWMRLLLVTVLLGFGIVVQLLVNRRMEDQLRLRLAATVFESAADAIVVTDSRNNILDVNPAFERATGYSKAEVLGCNPRILKSGKHEAPFYQAMWRQLLDRGHWEGEIWDRRKDGSLYPKWMSITVVRQADQASSFVAISRDISRFKKTEQQLQRLAHYDALTGLANRTLLNAHLEQAIHLAHRNAWQLAVVFIDLDHFKEINDSLGHSAGDRLLTAVAARLREQIRESDLIARLGGDEFVIILSKISATAPVAGVLEKIRLVLAQPFALESYELSVTASMGVSVYPADGSDRELLLRNADAAMYHAKDAGRDGWSFYSTDMNRQTRRRLQLSTGLRQAIQQQQFMLVYQPLLNLETGRISGIEALIRWQHPELGVVSPAEFIPLAEDTGLIEEVGEWVLAEACRQYRAWHHRRVNPARISVNVSARQFKSGRFPKLVQRVLGRTGMDPGCLELEITESLLVRGDARLLYDMRELRALGIRFSIDDFGTGYSSLSDLKRLPVSSLKADRSFVRDVPGDSDDVAILAATISMAHNLNLRVVAEGVETDAQLEFLRAQGCDELQGFLISRPLDAASIESLLHADHRVAGARPSPVPTPLEPA